MPGTRTAAEPLDPDELSFSALEALRLMPGSIWLPLLATALLVLGAVLVNDWSVARLHEQSEESQRLMQVQQQLIDLSATLTDADTGLRGFLLTREQPYLVPYERARAVLPAIGAQLRRQVGDDRELLEALLELEMLLTRRLGEMEATLALAQKGDRSGALAQFDINQRRLTGQAFRDGVGATITLIERRLQIMNRDRGLSIRWSRVASGATGALSLLLLFLLARMMTRESVRQDRLRSAEESQRIRLEQEVAARTQELSELTTHLQSVIEKEKQTLAHNLHDELGGLLTAARMDLSWLQGRAAALDPEFGGKLDELAETIGEAMNVKRRVVEDLRPALLDHFGLATALQSYFEETCRKAGIECRTRIPEDFERVSPELALALFRVGQESLTNIVRHAGARTVDVSLDLDDDHYVVDIVDDGKGMDVTRARSSHGIAGMRHRIETLGGRFTMSSSPGGGTRISIRVPRSSDATAR